ncbi:hypothetical protein GCM10009661_19580 [Catellatospora chokoriensis]|uniref:Uncharacterized protein n=1 Tax=Catellatospora chokoriensis TaxID=310353 RepID=A0A8J3K3L8_9ACTN|nr:hypothetical protein Cch02nite_59350 [Catellatospora chokoriensis]
MRLRRDDLELAADSLECLSHEEHLLVGFHIDPSQAEHRHRGRAAGHDTPTRIVHGLVDARWQQAFLYDAGRTCRNNWVMDLPRVAG